MAFNGGRLVSVVAAVESVPVYCNVAVAVLLSTVTGASMKGETETKYLPEVLSAVIIALVVCPGAIINVSIWNGLTYVASTSTTVSLCLAILKKSSSLSAALMIRSRYVLPFSTCKLNPPADYITLSDFGFLGKCEIMSRDFVARELKNLLKNNLVEVLDGRLWYEHRTHSVLNRTS